MPPVRDYLPSNENAKSDGNHVLPSPAGMPITVGAPALPAP
jgi:hypothetical protein